MRFCVLGGLDVRSARGPVALGGRKPRTVLAVLLLNADRTVPVDRLVDAVWPSDAPASAAKNLQTYVWSLRRALNDPADAEPRIVTRPDGYQLLLRPGELDLDEFERLSEEGRRLRRTDPGQARTLLREALALWRGPLLPDLVTALPDLAAEAARVEELRQVTVEERVEADLALGRHAELVAELGALVAAQPLREHLRGQQMRALHLGGRRADALATFHDLRDRLDAELGIRPSSELQRLHESILRSDTVRTPVRPPPVPAQLPADTAAFTGREDHIRQLDSIMLAADSLPVVALVGSSGVGKTSLAVRWAHRVRGHFPDGQLYVDLHGYAPQPPMPARQALAQFLRSLGVPAEQVPMAEDEAAGLYRSLLADRRMLVVLDDARGADQVRPLLPGGPGCAVLITSRDRLGGLVARDGAHALPLDVLSPGEADTLLRTLLGASRVDAEPAAAAELAAACGFLPLALRISAAHLAAEPHRGLAEYVTRLDHTDRLAALRVEGDPDSAVSAAFDQSYAALDADTRRLFRLLPLAPGTDVTAPAAAALADQRQDLTERQLARLLDGHVISQPLDGRYVVHELLRLYARQRTETEDTPAVRAEAMARLDHWYLASATHAAEVLYPQLARLPPPDRTGPSTEFADRTQSLAWLDAERTNLVGTALRAANEVTWRLADALRGYFRLRRTGPDWLAVAKAGVAAAEAADDAHGMAAARLSLADAYWSIGRHTSAAEHYTHAMAWCDKAGWIAGTAATLTNLGTLHWEMGRLDEATAHYTAALTRSREARSITGSVAGSVTGEAAILNNLGMVHRQLGMLDRAIGYHREALTRHEAAGSRVGTANALANLGVVYRLLGRLDDAVDQFTRSLAVHREVGSRAGEAQVLADIAEVHRLQGRPAEAVAVLADALALQQEIDHPSGAATTSLLLAVAHRDLGDPTTALNHARTAVTLAREVGNRRCEAMALAVVAGATGDLGEDPTTVLAGHAEALSVARAAGSREAETETQIAWAESAGRLNRPAQAAEHALAAVVLSRQSGHRLLEGRALTVLAAAEQARGASAESAKYAEQAQAIHQETGHRNGTKATEQPHH